jgi:hypothetical protein
MFVELHVAKAVRIVLLLMASSCATVTATGIDSETSAANRAAALSDKYTYLSSILYWYESTMVLHHDAEHCSAVVTQVLLL